MKKGNIAHPREFVMYLCVFVQERFVFVHAYVRFI